MVLERGNCHDHRKVGFAGARGANAEHNTVVPYGVKELFLSHCFGLDGLAFCRYEDTFLFQRGNGLLLARLYHIDAVACGLLIQIAAAAQNFQHLPRSFNGKLYILLLARYGEHLAATGQLDHKLPLDELKILVKCTCKFGCALRRAEIQFTCCHDTRLLRFGVIIP